MELARLTVDAGWHRRLWCPVGTAIDLPNDTALEKLALWDMTDGAAVPVQAWTGDDGKVQVSWIVAALEAHESRTYVLQSVEAVGKLTDGVQLEQAAPGKLKVCIGGKHFTTYNYGVDVVRPYLYPVLADDGVGITRNWPMVEGLAGESNDHPHHKGIYTAQDAINGIPNWGEGPGHGWQVHNGFSRTYDGPVAGGFTANLDWTDHDRQVYMTETRRVTFYNTPRHSRLIDYQVTLHASEGDLTIGDTKEGGLISIRVASSMDAARPDGGVITNGCGGIQEAETWGKRAPWCDYSGPVGDGQYGVCLMDHGGNPRYPSYWHVRAYGLMTANCFGRHDFTRDPENRWDMPLPAGASATWRYRVLVHHGDAQTAQPGLHYAGFSYPPTIEVKMPRRR